MTWNLEGQIVRGRYLSSIPVEGRVEESRVAYGGRVKHTVLLDTPIVVFDAIRDRVILDQDDILS